MICSYVMRRWQNPPDHMQLTIVVAAKCFQEQRAARRQHWRLKISLQTTGSHAKIKLVFTKGSTRVQVGRFLSEKKVLLNITANLKGGGYYVKGEYVSCKYTITLRGRFSPKTENASAAVREETGSQAD